LSSVDVAFRDASPADNAESIIIPSSIQIIRTGRFAGASLKRLSIPEPIKRILISFFVQGTKFACFGFETHSNLSSMDNLAFSFCIEIQTDPGSFLGAPGFGVLPSKTGT
jgi:hypothetical protein